MPCDSRIQATKFTSAERLAAALRAAGYDRVEVSADRTVVRSSGGSFTRNRDGEAFVTSARFLPAVGKKYAELGARAWAARGGYAVIEADADHMVLQNRRGA